MSSARRSISIHKSRRCDRGVLEDPDPVGCPAGISWLSKDAGGLQVEPPEPVEGGAPGVGSEKVPAVPYTPDGPADPVGFCPGIGWFITAPPLPEPEPEADPVPT